MGNTYTGTVRPVLAVVLQSDQVFPDNNNIQGTLVEIAALPAGKAVDNIFFFNSATAGKFYRRVIDGPIRAAQCAIYPDGTDKTTELNNALSNNQVWEIVFDYSDSANAYPTTNDIVINGTVTVPAGKTLTFRPGNRLTGTGTINGGIIDAPYSANIFATTLTVNPEGIAGERFSVKWFGATGGGSVNDQPAIQKSIDTVIANNSKLNRVYIPNGTYKCDAPLIMSRFSSGSYQFHTVFLEGETAWWPNNGTGTSLNFTFKDKFGIGIQLGKGTKLLNLRLNGLFTPPTATGYNWFKLDFSEFVDPTCRDSDTTPAAPFSPYAGIVIDPFSRTGSVPSDGGYPGLSTYYTQDATGSNGGSTGVDIEDVFVTNFVIGFICSPNGQTRNAEQIRWTKIQFAAVKAAFVNCTDQEKVNVIDMVGCWADVHTVFYKGGYGPGTPGVYKVSNINLAGRVNQFIFDTQGGYFASHFDHIFSESLGKFGTLESIKGSSVSNCELGFAQPNDETGAFANWVFEGGGITFNNCNIRYYGKGWPITIKGAFTWNNCVFETPPYFGNYSNQQPGNAYNLFLNCYATGPYDSGGFGVRTGPHYLQPQSFVTWMGGKYTVVDPVNAAREVRTEYIIDEELPYVLMETTTSFAITINSSGTTPFVRSTVVDVTAANVDLFEMNRAVFITLSSVEVLMGVVTNISGTIITISYIPEQIVNGTYLLYAMHPIKVLALIGNVTAASNVISSVDFDNAVSNGSQLVGKVIRSKILGGTGPGGIYARVIAGTATSITLNRNFNVTCNNVSIGFHKKAVKFIGRTVVSTQLPLLAGDTIEFYNTVSDQGGAPNNFVVVEAGFMDPTILGKTRKAISCSLEPFRGQSVKRTTATTIVPTLGIDIYEIDTTAGDVNVNIPYTSFIVLVSGSSKPIRIIKISSDDNVVYINKNTSFADQPISGQATITLVNQYDEAEINLSVINFDASTPYVTSVILNQ